MKLALAASAAALIAVWAQTTPDKPAEPRLLQNAGKPMLVDFHCTDDDIQYFGMSCSEDEPCPIYLELTAFEPVGNQLFAAGNIHTSINTLYSIVVASNDGGKTWREPYERMRGAGLDHVLFKDFEYGWISGQNLHPLPRDPFLLLTTDGGKSWRRRPVFDDNRSGSVQQIWFDSRTAGSLIFDRGQSGEEGMRYELHETATGGDGWMVREASEKPIRIRRMPTAAENPDWRLRADAASKSYRIEKRVGSQWTAAASFLVDIGSCTPAPVKEAAPPPETEAQAEATPPPTEDLSTFRIGGNPDSKKPASKKKKQ